jgi:hypothetical protein
MTAGSLNAEDEQALRATGDAFRFARRFDRVEIAKKGSRSNALRLIPTRSRRRALENSLPRSSTRHDAESAMRTTASAVASG